MSMDTKNQFVRGYKAFDVECSAHDQYRRGQTESCLGSARKTQSKGSAA